METTYAGFWANITWMAFLILILIYMPFMVNFFFSMKFLGRNEWSEGKYSYRPSIVDDEMIDDNLDLLIVLQYRRNPDHNG